VVNVTGLEAGGTWEYQLGAGAWTAGVGATFNMTADTTFAMGNIKVRQTDVAGNASAEGSNAQQWIEDSTVATPSIALNSDSGTAADFRTNDNVVNVTGLEAGGTWEYQLGAGAWTAGAGATFNMTADTTFAMGDIKVRQTDVAGNLSAVGSNAQAWIEDSTPPAAPSAPDLDAADDTGGSPTDNITKNTTALTFSGTAESGATVTLFNDFNNDGVYNGALSTDTILGTGTATGVIWSFDASTMVQGTYVVRAFATDAAGNVGTASVGATVLTVEVDTAAPDAPTLNLTAGDDSGTSDTDDITNVDVNLTLDGVAEPNAVVSIYQDGNLLDTVTADGGGVFTYDVVGPLGDASYAFTATQEDTAGNTSDPSATLNVTVDTVGPAVTYNNAVYDATANTLILSGTGFTGLSLAGIDETGMAWDSNSNDANVNVGEDRVFADGDFTGLSVGADGKTITLTLSGAAATTIEGLTSFGSAGAATMSLLDYLDISTAFAGTDVAGNTATGTASNMLVLGAQNQGAMPHTYTADLSMATGSVDDTMGAVAGDVNLAAPNFGGLGISGPAAAVSVLNVGGAGTSFTIKNGAAFDALGTNTLTVSGNTGDLTQADFTFSDGSILVENTGVSDTLIGTAQGDQLRAGASGDRLLGNAGNDLLIGKSGSDAIYGGTGADIIFGGGGNDYLSGGSGIDSFLYTSAANGEGHDAIYGFTAGAGGDVINVTGGGTTAALLGLATQSGSDTLITLSGTETIRLLGVSAASLTTANFGVISATIYDSVPV
jgi:GH24 family phage-related lysozyme (muramidase)